MELPENTGINKYTIKLQDGKQPPYGPIYSPRPVEMETFKTYIKINLITGFIRPFKSYASAPILFDKKPNGSFFLCVNYHGLNNLIIENWYLFPLIHKSLNQLDYAKRFIQLDLTSTYHWMRIKKGNK